MMMIFLWVILGVVLYATVALYRYRIKAKPIWVNMILHKKKCKRCGTDFEILCDVLDNIKEEIALTKAASIFWLPYYIIGGILVGISKAWNKIWTPVEDIARLEINQQELFESQRKELAKERANLIKELEQL